MSAHDTRSWPGLRVAALVIAIGSVLQAQPPTKALPTATEAPVANASGDPQTPRTTVDTDGDGVPDDLERGGYTFDPSTGQFRLWNRESEPEAPHWFTDPLQWSTDQDAYSDGMEASRAVMDVAVRAPGDDPLVPAYPNIVFQLTGYSVTLNEDITYDEGGALTKGSTWNRETQQISSQAYEVSAELGFSGYKVEGKIGASFTNTQTTSNAVSVGGSVLDESNWSRARCTNPTDAARIKLRVKVYNHGTACASNLFPTLTLRIGGINVATFEPGNAQINLLVPGAVYPPEPGVSWVIDSIDTGVGVIPLSLTLDELRALERGAPVSLSVTQLKADVMLADRAKGWTSAGDVNEYLARCTPVSANIRVEIGDGDFSHHLVFAGGRTSLPRLTLGEALGRIGLANDGSFVYRDAQGITRRTNLDGYSSIFDPETLAVNGWNLTTSPPTPPEGFSVMNMVLGPASSVIFRAPREASDLGPTIHYVNADSGTRRIHLCVSDYQGIRSLECLDKQGTPFRDENQEPVPLVEEIAGSGFYQALIPDPYYVFDGTEKVVVTNLAGQTTEQTISVVYDNKPPDPEAPTINAVHVNWFLDPPRIYANVTNPQPRYPLQWIRVFHPDLGQKGFVELEEAAERYRDPDGWEARLEGVSKGDSLKLKVVAYVQPGIYTEKVVSEVALAQLKPRVDWKGKNYWIRSALDFDAESDNVRTSGLLDEYPGLVQAPFDITATAHEGNLLLRFSRPFAVKELEGDQYAFAKLNKEGIGRLLETLPQKGGFTIAHKDDEDATRGRIYVMQTEGGNLVKFQIDVLEHNLTQWKRNAVLELSYVVYTPESQGEDTIRSEEKEDLPASATPRTRSTRSG
ncbi:binary toxin-like calcium binding domain-containing protein [Tautonia rosea]|uniref:binary toxin-like calcium binding domain-containing protein n=1 Tax=Tautonia rosea TaxID=2728037 RepID=UPI0014766513|nr:binary toxin-like calcium binding domain-containing protein [Tautonia rosea]